MRINVQSFSRVWRRSAHKEDGGRDPSGETAPILDCFKKKKEEEEEIKKTAYLFLHKAVTKKKESKRCSLYK